MVQNIVGQVKLSEMDVPGTNVVSQNQKEAHMT